MTGRERMLKALRFEEPDRPPRFETMFELEREAFGLSFPDRGSWRSMDAAGKERAIELCMEIYGRIIERYSWDALAVYWPWSDPDGVRAAKRLFGSSALIGSIVGGSVWSIECVSDWTQFSIDVADNLDALKEEAERKTLRALKSIEALADAGADFILLVNDVAFNSGPFISPALFHELVFPHLARQVARIRELGAIPFVHSDGDVSKLLDDYLETGAACFQSVDPMAGMDIAAVKRRCHGRMALMGNVQCSLLQDGPDEAIRQSALYCLRNASPGGGYIFSSSNTIFPGLPLGNYELMLDVYKDFLSERKAQALRPEPGLAGLAEVPVH